MTLYSKPADETPAIPNGPGKSLKSLGIRIASPKIKRHAHAIMMTNIGYASTLTGLIWLCGFRKNLAESHDHERTEFVYGNTPSASKKD
ncbi:hypothetical protein F4809DRAFT_645318 [Biscogniauxia mediterranea]|nr:hypothetical protein F4809DRAFT_645318 [Biscogniauxia mediterranea]